ncbi:hypothetical protein N4G41_03820 [Kosakonia sacchari]|uniref:hypothetical protein n=1 Tax=Kosakonia sacchari TaxID=1158459 RepID=UPI002ACE51B2|nr:hypothetical protein [Kosakonia sacchari]MDZ7320757.1 hypothetical protein [Kosakonia sacchari]
MKKSLLTLAILLFPLVVHTSPLVNIDRERCPLTYNSLTATKLMGYDIRYGEPKEDLMHGPALCVRNHIYWRIQELAHINHDLVSLNEVKCASSLAYSSVREFWEGVEIKDEYWRLDSNTQTQESRIREANKHFKGVNLNCRSLDERDSYRGYSNVHMDRLLEINSSVIIDESKLDIDAHSNISKKPMPVYSQGGWEPIID